MIVASISLIFSLIFISWPNQQANHFSRQPASQELATTREVIKNCLDEFCQTFSEDIGNTSIQITDFEGDYYNHKENIIASAYGDCVEEIQASHSLKQQLKNRLLDYFNHKKNVCINTLHQTRIHQQYLADYSFLRTIANKVIEEHTPIFPQSFLDHFKELIPNKKIQCYYDQMLEEQINYAIRQECSKNNPLAQKNNQGIWEENSDQQNTDAFDGCLPLKEIDLEQAPLAATFDSPGDYNDGDQVLFSNQTCSNKTLGSGTVAHEMTHSLTKAWSEYPSKGFWSSMKFKSIRRCLNTFYKEKESAHSLTKRVDGDLLHTEEDYADIFKFLIGRSSTPYACYIYNDTLRLIRSEQRRLTLGVYDPVIASNEHSSIIARLFHELEYRGFNIPESCIEAKQVIRKHFKARKCYSD